MFLGNLLPGLNHYIFMTLFNLPKNLTEKLLFFLLSRLGNLFSVWDQVQRDQFKKYIYSSEAETPLECLGFGIPNRAEHFFIFKCSYKKQSGALKSRMIFKMPCELWWYFLTNFLNKSNEINDRIQEKIAFSRDFFYTLRLSYRKR